MMFWAASSLLYTLYIDYIHLHHVQRLLCFWKFKKIGSLNFRARLELKLDPIPKLKSKIDKMKFLEMGMELGGSTQESCRRTRMLRSGLTLQPRNSPTSSNCVCMRNRTYIHSPTPRNWNAATWYLVQNNFKPIKSNRSFEYQRVPPQSNPFHSNPFHSSHSSLTHLVDQSNAARTTIATGTTRGSRGSL